MRHEGYEAAKGRRRKICRSFTCISPWTIFLRWFSGGKSRFSKTKFTERDWGKWKIAGDLDVETKIGMESASFAEDFSEIGKEASFNLGVGFGLIYLVRNELNKMVELRRKIESLLQQFQTEMEIQDDMPSTSSISSSLSKEIMYAEEHDHSDQFSLPDDHVKHPKISFRGEKSLRMDQLEAELEAEFDRLQLRMDGEFLYPEVNVEQNAAELNEFEEVGELQEFSKDEFGGVSPKDLERKLHRVLESRQQERIKELESGLEHAMQQLEEKETELSLWRDAGRLVARHLPAISTVLFQVKQSMEPEFGVRETAASVMRNSMYKHNIQTI
ncbi:hypothetical protein C2S51_017651 [Perilla frutescens var. frutescens]|nr:hypothetical protein C2S51_017651 [Perilla frutescens var. frutescens]